MDTTERLALFNENAAKAERMARSWAFGTRRLDEIEDMVQEGLLGLWRACLDFDPSRGVKFSTFAHMRVESAVGHYLRDKSFVVRPPRRVNGRAVRGGEVWSLMAPFLQPTAEMRKHRAGPDGEEVSAPAELVEDPSAEASFAAVEMRDAIRRAVRGMTRDEQVYIWATLHGLEDEDLQKHFGLKVDAAKSGVRRRLAEAMAS